MVEKESYKESDLHFRKLYPHLTDTQLIQAQNNFDAYLEIVWRIYERIKNDPAEHARFKKLVEESKKDQKK